MENESVKKTSKFTKLAPLVGFLSYEVIAFIAFSLANSFLLYSIMSLVLVILLALVTRNQISKDGYSNYLFFAFPILIFGILSAISYFNASEYVDSSRMIVRIFIPIGLASLGLVGCFVTKTEGFKIKYAILAIYAALAIYVFINFMVTMIQYVPFYTIKYRNAFIYYKGKPSPLPVGKTAYALIGFSMESVTVDYFSLFPSVLSTAAIALFYIDPKKERKPFVLYAVFAFIGIITLLFTPTIMTVITDVLLIAASAVIVLSGKGKIKSNVVKKIVIAIAIVLGVGLLGLIIISQSSIGFIRNLIQNNPVFRKLFGNHVVQAYADIFDGMFSTNKLFGFPPYYDESKHMNIWPSGGWISDMFMTSGLLGYAFFIFVCYSSIKYAFTYISKSDDSVKDKSLLIALLVSILGYTMLNYDGRPFVYSSEAINLLTKSPFILVFFIFGYISGSAINIQESEKAIEATKTVEEGPISYEK